MVLLRQTCMQTVVDAPVSDLLAHWIVEQQQHDGLCLRERPRIGILAARGYVRDGGWPAYVGMHPLCMLYWKLEVHLGSFRHCP